MTENDEVEAMATDEKRWWDTLVEGARAHRDSEFLTVPKGVLGYFHDQVGEARGLIYDDGLVDEYAPLTHMAGSAVHVALQTQQTLLGVIMVRNNSAEEEKAHKYDEVISELTSRTGAAIAVALQLISIIKEHVQIELNQEFIRFNDNICLVSDMGKKKAGKVVGMVKPLWGSQDVAQAG